MFDFFKLSAPAKYSEQLLNAENLSFNPDDSQRWKLTEYGYSKFLAKYKCLRLFQHCEYLGRWVGFRLNHKMSLLWIEIRQM